MPNVGLDTLVAKLRKRADEYEKPYKDEGKALDWYASPNYAIAMSLREVAQQMENIIMEGRND